MTLDDLRAIVAQAPREELPALVGQLAAAQAEALARLTTAHTSPPPAVDRVLSMAEVADRLGVSLYTARERGRSGELPVVKVGRHVGVRESSLQRYLELKER